MDDRRPDFALDLRPDFAWTSRQIRYFHPLTATFHLAELSHCSPDMDVTQVLAVRILPPHLLAQLGGPAKAQYWFDLIVEPAMDVTGLTASALMRGGQPLRTFWPQPEERHTKEDPPTTPCAVWAAQGDTAEEAARFLPCQLCDPLTVTHLQKQIHTGEIHLGMQQARDAYVARQGDRDNPLWRAGYRVGSLLEQADAITTAGSSTGISISSSIYLLLFMGIAAAVAIVWRWRNRNSCRWSSPEQDIQDPGIPGQEVTPRRVGMPIQSQRSKPTGRRQVGLWNQRTAEWDLQDHPHFGGKKGGKGKLGTVDTGGVDLPFGQKNPF